MKSFVASTLAASTLAATYTRNWSGNALKNDKTVTPKGSSSWTISNNVMVETFTTTATFSSSKKLDNKKEEVQPWWCETGHCHLFQFKTDAKSSPTYEIKARHFTKSNGSPKPSPTSNKNAKDWFSSSSNGWKMGTEVDLTKKGTAATKIKKTVVNGAFKINTSACTVSGSKMTGSFKAVWNNTDTAIRRKGKTSAG